MFLGGFWGRDGPPARGAFPRRSGPTQGPCRAARSPGGAGLVKRAPAAEAPVPRRSGVGQARKRACD